MAKEDNFNLPLKHLEFPYLYVPILGEFQDKLKLSGVIEDKAGNLKDLVSGSSIVSIPVWEEIILLLMGLDDIPNTSY